MEIADLISRLHSEIYAFSGVSFNSEVPFRWSAFDAKFQFLYSDPALLVEGTVLHPAHSEPVPFSLSIPFGSIRLNGALVELKCSLLGLVQGRVLTMGEGFEFLGLSPSGKPCSAHLRFASKRAFEVSGMLTIKEHCVAFTAQESGPWREAAVAKVYPLRRG